MGGCAKGQAQRHLRQCGQVQPVGFQLTGLQRFTCRARRTLAAVSQVAAGPGQAILGGKGQPFGIDFKTVRQQSGTQPARSRHQRQRLQ